MNSLLSAIEAGFNGKTYKIILSKPRVKSAAIKKIVISQLSGTYHLEKFTATQVFNENLLVGQLKEFLVQSLEKDFQQYNAWDDQFEYIIQIIGANNSKLAKNCINNFIAASKSTCM